jgi:hypothetical protein
MVVSRKNWLFSDVSGGRIKGNGHHGNRSGGPLNNGVGRGSWERCERCNELGCRCTGRGDDVRATPGQRQQLSVVDTCTTLVDALRENLHLKRTKKAAIAVSAARLPY